MYQGFYNLALGGRGFFAVQGENGTVYTRNGSFAVDQEGYLAMAHVGRVLGSLHIMLPERSSPSDSCIYKYADSGIVVMVKQVLAREQLHLRAEDTGGNYARTMTVNVENGDVVIRTVAFRVQSIEGISRISWKDIQKPDKTLAHGDESIATGTWW